MYVSIVIPIFNEEDTLDSLYSALDRVASSVGVDLEFLFIDDGSTDSSLQKIEQLSACDARVSFLSLSRNFGKEAALSAGIDHANGAAVIFIDADLQDPPELIPEMIARWQEGYDAVYARRTDRNTDTSTKRQSARAFYWLLTRMSKVSIPADTGDFRLVSRRSILALRSLPESNRFMKGLFAWIGYKQTEITYTRQPRAAGNTKFDYWKLWNFALDGIASFSTLPLKLASYIGGLISLCAIIYGVFVVAKTLIVGDPVAGYPSLMVVILFLGGIQLMCLGVFGEYLGRMFDEVKRRPVYLVDRKHLPAKTEP